MGRGTGRLKRLDRRGSIQKARLARVDSPVDECGHGKSHRRDARQPSELGCRCWVSHMPMAGISDPSQGQFPSANRRAEATYRSREHQPRVLKYRRFRGQLRGPNSNRSVIESRMIDSGRGCGDWAVPSPRLRCSSESQFNDFVCLKNPCSRPMPGKLNGHVLTLSILCGLDVGH
jgi:hypothetical protein